MAEPVFLILGATGATADRLVDHLADDLGYLVYGVCRTSPDASRPFTHIQADLADAAQCQDAFRSLTDVTHMVYAARAAHGESGVEDVGLNLAMLRNVLDTIEPVATDLAHVHLLEGAKWYGVHIGPYRTPAREDDPRHLPPNFYYDQQDFLEERQRGAAWSWSASRPHVVCDVSPGRARNIVSVIGAYAALCRELGVPLDFPGSAKSYETLTEVTDARLLARAITWICTKPETANQAFNVTNGDLFRWANIWPMFADHFGVPVGIPRTVELATWMADKGEVWRKLALREGLADPDLERVANWPFADFVFAQDYDVASDVGRLRRTGFCQSVDTFEMFRSYFQAYQEKRVLP